MATLLLLASPAVGQPVRWSKVRLVHGHPQKIRDSARQIRYLRPSRTTTYDCGPACGSGKSGHLQSAELAPKSLRCCTRVSCSPQGLSQIANRGTSNSVPLIERWGVCRSRTKPASTRKARISPVSQGSSIKVVHHPATRVPPSSQ